MLPGNSLKSQWPKVLINQRFWQLIAAFFSGGFRRQQSAAETFSEIKSFG